MLVAAGYIVARGISMFSVVVLPLVIALLLTALVVPVVEALVPAAASRAGSRPCSSVIGERSRSSRCC